MKIKEEFAMMDFFLKSCQRLYEENQADIKNRTGFKSSGEYNTGYIQGLMDVSDAMSKWRKLDK